MLCVITCHNCGLWAASASFRAIALLSATALWRHSERLLYCEQQHCDVCGACQLDEGEVGRACSMCGAEEKWIGVYGWETWRKQALGRPSGKWKYILNLYFKEIRYDCQEENWCGSEYRHISVCCYHGNENAGCIQSRDCWIANDLKKDSNIVTDT